MRILFIYRGYGKDLSNSVIDFQRESLLKRGIEIEKFPIHAGGMGGYIKAIKKLRKYLENRTYDIIHAHYSFSGFVACLSTRKPVICSLMGSDILQHSRAIVSITRFFSEYLWAATIVKTREMKEVLKKSILLPNGVDFSNFRPIPREEALRKTEFNPSERNIIFVAQDPKSRVKNLSLAEKSIRLINDENVKLHIISNVPFAELPYFYNAADLLLLTSLSEGSPNVIKEAMACNCPIVSTDVGDVKDVIGDMEGCYITSFEAEDVADKIKIALEFGKRTNGRQHIIDLGLDSKSIAKKINKIYKSII